MARIRHIALQAEDTAALAEFYKTTFGLHEVGRLTVADGRTAVFVSDGEINLAIIPARGDREGIHHFGFTVDDVRESGRVAKDAGAQTGIAPRPRDGRYAEFRIHDPVGTPLDLSEHDWDTAPGARG